MHPGTCAERTERALEAVRQAAVATRWIANAYRDGCVRGVPQAKLEKQIQKVAGAEREARATMMGTLLVTLAGACTAMGLDADQVACRAFAEERARAARETEQ